MILGLDLKMSASIALFNYFSIEPFHRQRILIENDEMGLGLNGENVIDRDGDVAAIDDRLEAERCKIKIKRALYIYYIIFAGHLIFNLDILIIALMLVAYILWYNIFSLIEAGQECYVQCFAALSLIIIHMMELFMLAEDDRNSLAQWLTVALWGIMMRLMTMTVAYYIDN